MTAVAGMPDWLRARAATSGNGNGLAPVVGETIPKGKQHATLVSLAGTMRRRGMGVSEIAAALKETNRERLEEPAPDRHIDVIAKSVCRLYPPGDGPPASQNGDATSPSRAGSGRVAWATDVRAEPVDWLVRERIPLGVVAMLAGVPGLGKSAWTALCAAELSRGDHGEACVTLFASAEESASRMIKPRLAAAGADLSRIGFFTIADEYGQRELTFPDDMAPLEESIVATHARLVVVDPLNAFLSADVDSHKDQSIRRVLAPLARVAEERSATFLCVVHLRKERGGPGVYRLGGSVGYGGAARSVLALGQDPEDPDGEQGHLRLLGHIKCNYGPLAPTLSYRHEPHDVFLDDDIHSTHRLVYVGVSDADPSAALDEPRRVDRIDDAEEAIAEQLADGMPKPSRGVKTAVMAELDVSERTVKRAAHRMQGRGELLIERTNTRVRRRRGSSRLPSRARATLPLMARLTKPR